jgi:putative sterol carrier protein
LDKVFQGMIDHYLPEKAKDYGGTIEWNLRSSQQNYTYNMTFLGSNCTVKTGSVASAQVRMTADIPVFLRLVAGRLNGLQAYADGKLQVVGDMVLAQLQQTFFNTDLSRAALNISTPSQLSKLIRDRSNEEIEAGVSVTGVDRALDMVFKGMVEHFLPHKAKAKSAIVQWDIHTPEGIRSYQFRVNRGACSYDRGTPNKSNVTLSAKLPSFLRIVAGQLDGIRALATGKIKVRGNIFLARSHQGWFDFSR